MTFDILIDYKLILPKLLVPLKETWGHMSSLYGYIFLKIIVYTDTHNE